MTSTHPQPRNVLGGILETCGCQPMTGWMRDGICRTDALDFGRHTVCAVVTTSFLSYSSAQGNDLSTPRPEYSFPGLQPGDRWCVCASRWQQALEDGMAPPVVLAATEISTLDLVSLEDLKAHAWSGDSDATGG
ncbi:MAG: DUF2237 domain-containing protein [Synechococcus sp. SB0668_bin_15]|nr:DUF2237 domain-containing protein [Synechococcus sp. SB0668_bin_15]MXZ83988.1 DUF2237 domain-containing protein [Synechococcus sp. SB0666_bin_14]MYA90718.1 DUF2237 domain-containing protein [Synechococcus sp. SB0663_bin_10]MYC49445.1 DUF2237 domain-containing protein [Synechococcus sp. SB0662_bin_14]MYG46530.1 DUF2237 domain-containing protein [Synechococcus sp. SB0675_bin_6]MYK90759.1 DUF2237 domain-containing protein [Synechococcus sp. SB0669_bin_8]